MAAKPEMMQHMHGMMMRQACREHEEQHEHGGGRGAYLRFKRGDAEVDIRCPEDESMRDCLSAAGSLLISSISLSRQPSPPPSSSHSRSQKGLFFRCSLDDLLRDRSVGAGIWAG